MLTDSSPRLSLPARDSMRAMGIHQMAMPRPDRS